MTDQRALETAYTDTLSAITANDLVALIPQIERFRATKDLDEVIRTARPSAKVQRRFMPLNVQGEIFKVGLRQAKAQSLVQDVVIGLYAEEIGDDVVDPSLAQLQAATKTVLAMVPRPLVQLTLLGVVVREEVATPHAITVLRETFGINLGS